MRAHFSSLLTAIQNGRHFEAQRARCILKPQHRTVDKLLRLAVASDENRTVGVLNFLNVMEFLAFSPGKNTQVDKMLCS